MLAFNPSGVNGENCLAVRLKKQNCVKYGGVRRPCAIPVHARELIGFDAGAEVAFVVGSCQNLPEQLHVHLS